MGIRTSLAPFIELLHRALTAQVVHGQAESRALIESLDQQLQVLLGQESPLIISSSKGHLWHQGQMIRNTPAATQTIAREMELRGFNGLAFYAGIDYEELELCIFVLQLPVQRLRDMGGVLALTAGNANIAFLGTPLARVGASEHPRPRWSPGLDPIGAMELSRPEITFERALERQ